jgi:hypothetical protein
LPPPQPTDEQAWSIDFKNRNFNFRATPFPAAPDQQPGFIIEMEERTGERKASELLNKLVHELVVPLQTICAYADLLLLVAQDTQTLTDEQRGWAEKILQRGKWLSELREQILSEHRHNLHLSDREPPEG